MSVLDLDPLDSQRCQTSMTASICQAVPQKARLGYCLYEERVSGDYGMSARVYDWAAAGPRNPMLQEMAQPDSVVSARVYPARPSGRGPANCGCWLTFAGGLLVCASNIGAYVACK